MTIYEVINGDLKPNTLNGANEFYLNDISYLMIKPISNHYYCITNSFKNMSFIIDAEEWHGVGIYPTDFENFVGYPEVPLMSISVPKKVMQLYDNTATFIIAMSYRCNLRCKYCYQQCNEELDKSQITDENLSSIFDNIIKFHNKNPEKMINIGLFGGEPLLPENHDIIIRIFDFCVENSFSVSITTNGVYLPMYLKDLVIYSGLNILVSTTVDSIAKNEATRFSLNDGGDSRSSSILKSVWTLINNDVQCSIEMNIDKHNINEISSMIEFYKENGFLDNSNFDLGIGLVDDRRYETGYADTISETELIRELEKLDLSYNNIYYAFVKAPLNLCKKIYPSFKQSEIKYDSNYCWASAPLDYSFYIDSDLDVFRCAFSVGRKEYSLFKFSFDELEKYKMPNKTYMDRLCCRKCNIGGYCSGGCSLSADVDFKRMCDEEKNSFIEFMDQIYYTKIIQLLESI